MGWWNQDEDGNSFRESDMLWGDSAADAMDRAMVEIVEAFEQYAGRRPTKAEVRAGLEFSIGHLEGEFV